MVFSSYFINTVSLAIATKGELRHVTLSVNPFLVFLLLCGSDRKTAAVLTLFFSLILQYPPVPLTHTPTHIHQAGYFMYHN